MNNQADKNKIAAGKGSINKGDISAEELQSYNVKQDMGKAVADSNNPNNSVGDPSGKFHEEGGTASTAADGKEHVVRAAPGGGDPSMTKDGLGVNTTTPADPKSVPAGYSPNLTFHVHPAGTKFNVKTGVTKSFHSSASDADIRNDGSRPIGIKRNYVLSAGSNTVHIYDHSGSQVATFPLNSFIFTKP